MIYHSVEHSFVSRDIITTLTVAADIEYQSALSGNRDPDFKMAFKKAKIGLDQYLEDNPSDFLLPSGLYIDHGESKGSSKT